MNKDAYPSWMLPLVALFAMVLGVNRITTAPPANDETAETATSMGEKKPPTRSSGEGAEEPQDALLFYEHDAFHILRNFFDTENLTKDNKVKLEISYKSAKAGLDIDATSESKAPDDEDPQKLWMKVHDWLRPGMEDQRYHLDFMIVGVPDPEASHLRMETDWTLDMVQRGLEASSHRFILDRFDLPWRPRVRGEQRQSEEEAPRRPDEEPGLMLFRCGKNPKEHHLVLVFLVGETPTAGVHKTALTRAITQIVALTNLAQSETSNDTTTSDAPPPWRGVVKACKSESPNASCSTKLIPLLGPHFTGSVPSYLLAFHPWNPRFDCVTGSATGIPPAIIDGTARANQLNVSFAATQWPDAEKTKWLRNYLKTQFGATHDELAVLHESNTGYGNSGTPSPSPGASPTPTSDSSEEIHVPFPMHISRLRNSKGDSGGGLASSNAGSRTRPFLPLTTTEKEEEDLLPPFSEGENISNWRVLESILGTLRRQKIRFVVIRATNIEDVIFLAREVERYCPNTMIFLLGSDDLFLNPDAISALRGTIMLTSYPLLAYNQEWTRLFAGDSHRVIHFPTQGAEGTYNAVLALLSKIHAASPHQAEKRDAIREIGRMLDYRNPFDHTSICCPPLWMSVVGNDSMWPVQFFSVDASESPRASFLGPVLTWLSLSSIPVDASTLSLGPVLDYLYVPPHGLIERNNWRSVGPPLTDDAVDAEGDKYDHRIALTLALSRGTSAAFWALWTLTAYFAMVLYHPELWLMHDNTFARTLIAREAQTKDRYLICFAVLLWLMSLMLCALSFFPIASAHWAELATWTWSWPELRTWVVFSIASGTALFISFYPIGRLDEDFPVLVKSFLFLGLPSTVVLIATPAFGVLTSTGTSEAQKILDYFRFSNIGNGVSMFLPLLYLDIAAMFWVFSNLRRLMFSERIAMSQHDPHEGSLGLAGEANFAGLKDSEERVNRTVRTPSHRYLYGDGSWQLAAGTTAAVLFGCLAFGLAPVGWKFWGATIEPGWFYTVFVFSLLLIGVALACELMATFDLWRTLRDFLDRVSGEQFLKAFDGEKDEYSVRPKFSISAPYSDLTVIRLALEELERSHALSCEVQKKIGEARAALQKVESGTGPVIKNRMALSTRLKELTATALEEKPWGTNEAIRRLLYYRVFDYSQRIAHAIRNLLVWATAGLFFLLLAISSYPFPNNDALLRLGWIFILTATFTSMAILVAMNRNRVLSIFSGGTPGKIDWNSSFVFHMLILALLPMLGVLGVQFPQTFQSTTSLLGSWFNSAPHP